MQINAKHSRRHRSTIFILAAVGFVFVGATLWQPFGKAGDSPSPIIASAATLDAATAQEQEQQAFLEAYKVFMHPRCMNCHPIQDAPLQGDDSRPHAMNVKRGQDGKGLFALKCANCHQEHNLPGEHMPPGNAVWHLPPRNMRMVFEGKSPAELARLLTDPEKNGGKSLEDLLHHVTEDKLVKWGWNPGDGREAPPISHEDFIQLMRQWIDAGAPIPE